jgi:hypothetical protein
MAAVAYYILQSFIIAEEGGRKSKLAHAIGNDWKGKLSPVLYAVGIAATFFRPWLAGSIYAAVALMWLIPDRRIERVLGDSESSR